MKNLLKKRSGAILVLVLVIVFSTIFSAHRSLTSKRSAIEAMLITGVDGSGIGINSDMEKRVDYSRNLIKIARGYEGLDSEIDNLSAACDALASRKGGASESYRLNQALTDAALELYMAAEGKMSEKDEQYRQELYANISSRNDTITNEAARYNRLALEFNNDILGTFPTNLLRWPALVSDCELFA